MARKIGPPLLPDRQRGDLWLPRLPISQHRLLEPTAQTLMMLMYDVLAETESVVRSAEYTGGYCVIMNVPTGGYYQFPVGTLIYKKWPKRMAVSLEKARRLRRQLSRGHLSSWQSRDEAKERWGGAIVTGRRPSDARHIISFSGLPQLADEALCLCLAIRLRMMRLERACQIADISSSRQYLWPMLARMGIAG